jgi:hypothetical protein
MTIASMPRCYKCKHLDVMNAAGMSCKAFPEEIPDEIALGDNDHSKPVSGQIGSYVFEEDDTSNL